MNQSQQIAQLTEQIQKLNERLYSIENVDKMYIRKAIAGLYEENRVESNELKLLLEPGRLKGEIRSLVSFMIFGTEGAREESLRYLLAQDFEQFIRTRLYNQVVMQIESVVESNIKSTLDKDYLTEELKKEFNLLIEKDMAPIVEKIAAVCIAKVRKNMSRTLMQQVNLATSSISEVRAQMDKLPVDTFASIQKAIDVDDNERLEVRGGDLYLE